MVILTDLDVKHHSEFNYGDYKSIASK